MSNGDVKAVGSDGNSNYDNNTATYPNAIDHTRIEFYIPDDIPPEVLAYEAKLAQLEVGRAGKTGLLYLMLEGASNGRTVIKEKFSKVPLVVLKAMYLEESLPGMAYVYIMSPSGGVLQGDRYRMDIVLRNKAMLHVTTQGATRIYRMNRNYATQMVNISVDKDCYMEYIPDQIIPYRDSRFYQRVNLNVHEHGTLVYSDIIVPGRVARDEAFQYDICYMKAIARNQYGSIRFIDNVVLEPKKSNLKTMGILDDRDVVGSIYILTRTEYVNAISEEVNSALKHFNIVGGASILPNDSGVMVRLLGSVAEDVRGFAYEVVRIVRRVVLNARFSGIRKG
ncbi:MAG: urease accessory protein UreD [Candidatus Nitrosocaldus sp.]|nr:urease accessory protein UreD [Candidatus Nitrosocaldus sp.]MDW8275874.1 urease accessory protein UreD [Candidatus Nitrosocaldus sp.]